MNLPFLNVDVFIFSLSSFLGKLITSQNIVSETKKKYTISQLENNLHKMEKINSVDELMGIISFLPIL